MTKSILLPAAAVLLVGMFFVAAPAGSQEKQLVTFRDLERHWQRLAAFAEPGDHARNTDVTIEWIPNGLSSHWEHDRQMSRKTYKTDRGSFPAERIEKLLTPSQWDRFLEGLRSDRALRMVTNSASETELGAGGYGIVAIAKIELTRKGGETEVLKLDLSGLRGKGGPNHSVYSGYLADLLDDLALEHVGSRLPPSVIEAVSGEAFIRASRAAHRVDHIYEPEANQAK